MRKLGNLFTGRKETEREVINVEEEPKTQGEGGKEGENGGQTEGRNEGEIKGEDGTEGQTAQDVGQDQGRRRGKKKKRRDNTTGGNPQGQSNTAPSSGGSSFHSSAASTVINLYDIKQHSPTPSPGSREDVQPTTEESAKEPQTEHDDNRKESSVSVHPGEEASWDLDSADYLGHQEIIDRHPSPPSTIEESQSRSEDAPLLENDDRSSDETNEPTTVIHITPPQAGATSAEPSHQVRRATRSRNPSPEPIPVSAQTQPLLEQGQPEHGGQREPVSNEQTSTISPPTPSKMSSTPPKEHGIFIPKNGANKYREKAPENDSSDSDSPPRKLQSIPARSGIPANPRATPLSDNLITQFGRIGPEPQQPQSMTRDGEPKTGEYYLHPTTNMWGNQPLSSNAGSQQQTGHDGGGSVTPSQTTQSQVFSGWDPYLGSGWKTAVGLGSQMNAPVPGEALGTGGNTGSQAQLGPTMGSRSPPLPGPSPSNSQHMAQGRSDSRTSPNNGKQQKRKHQAGARTDPKPSVTGPVRSNPSRAARPNLNRPIGKLSRNRTGLLKVSELRGEAESSPKNARAFKPTASLGVPPSRQDRGYEQAVEGESQPMNIGHGRRQIPQVESGGVDSTPPFVPTETLDQDPGNDSDDISSLSSNDGSDSGSSSGAGEDSDNDLDKGSDDDSNDSSNDASDEQEERGGGAGAEQGPAPALPGLGHLFAYDRDQPWHIVPVNPGLPKHTTPHGSITGFAPSPEANVSHSTGAGFLDGGVTMAGSPYAPWPEGQIYENFQSYPQPAWRNAASRFNSVRGTGGQDQPPSGFTSVNPQQAHSFGAPIPATILPPVYQASSDQNMLAPFMPTYPPQGQLLQPIPEERDTSSMLGQLPVQGQRAFTGDRMNVGRSQHHAPVDSSNAQANRAGSGQQDLPQSNALILEGSQHQFPPAEDHRHYKGEQASYEPRNEYENQMLRQIGRAEGASIPAKLPYPQPPNGGGRGAHLVLNPPTVPGYDTTIRRAGNTYQYPQQWIGIQENIPPQTTNPEWMTFNQGYTHNPEGINRLAERITAPIAYDQPLQYIPHPSRISPTPHYEVSQYKNGMEGTLGQPMVSSSMYPFDQQPVGNENPGGQNQATNPPKERVDGIYPSGSFEASARGRAPGSKQGKSMPKEMHRISSGSPGPRKGKTHTKLSKAVLQKTFPKRKPMRRMRTWASEQEKFNLLNNSKAAQDMIPLPNYPVLSRPGYRIETPEKLPSVPGLDSEESGSDQLIPSIEEPGRYEGAPKPTTSRPTTFTSTSFKDTGPKATTSSARTITVTTYNVRIPNGPRATTSKATRRKKKLNWAPKVPTDKSSSYSSGGDIPYSYGKNDAEGVDESGENGEEHEGKGDGRDKENNGNDGNKNVADPSQDVSNAQKIPPPPPGLKKHGESPPRARTRARTRAATAGVKGDNATSLPKAAPGKPAAVPKKAAGVKSSAQKTATTKQPAAATKKGGAKAPAATKKAPTKKTAPAKGQAVPVNEDDGGDSAPAELKKSSKKLADARRANTSIPPSPQQKRGPGRPSKQPTQSGKQPQSKPASPAKRAADEAPQDGSPSKRKKTTTKKR